MPASATWSKGMSELWIESRRTTKRDSYPSSVSFLNEVFRKKGSTTLTGRLQLLKDVPDLCQLLTLCTERLHTSPEYEDPLCRIVELCRWVGKSTHTTTAQWNIPTYANDLGGWPVLSQPGWPLSQNTQPSVSEREGIRWNDVHTGCHRAPEDARSRDECWHGASEGSSGPICGYLLHKPAWASGYRG